MRIFAILAILFLAGCVDMQPVAEEDRTFDGVFEVPGISKEQIFNATKIWVAENFHSAKSVIEYENKEEGTLIGNGVTRYPCAGIDCLAKQDWNVPFTMRVDMKDQKLKLTFLNIRLSWPPSYNSTIGVQPGYDGPLIRQSDMDVIKPKLLAFGHKLVAAIQENNKVKDW